MPDTTAASTLCALELGQRIVVVVDADVDDASFQASARGAGGQSGRTYFFGRSS
jgi:hypothetical protein